MHPFASREGKARYKAKLHDIWMAETREEAEKALALFVEAYAAQVPEGGGEAAEGRDVLLAFYDFSAERWSHLRAMNPIESTFATVRLRTRKTKGSGSHLACLTMIFKLAQSAEKKWRKPNSYQLLADVIRGVQFQEGIEREAA